MKPLNWIFTFSSLVLIIASTERFSVTGKIFLTAHFLQLHQLIQMSLIFLATVIITIFTLKIVSHNFVALKNSYGFSLFLLFIVGIYFYATGNGVHEVSSFNFNNFCDIQHSANTMCGSFFINDYYTGNIMFFIGAALISITTLLFEKNHPSSAFTKKDMSILFLNAVVYALAIFAYAAFDRVAIGLIYTVNMTIIATALFLTIRKKLTQYPFITYTFLAYLLGMIATVYQRILL